MDTNFVILASSPSEVAKALEILKMFGGKDTLEISPKKDGVTDHLYLFIDTEGKDRLICCSYTNPLESRDMYSKGFSVFTVRQFLRKYPLVGDSVLVNRTTPGFIFPLPIISAEWRKGDNEPTYCVSTEDGIIWPTRLNDLIKVEL